MGRNYNYLFFIILILFSLFFINVYSSIDSCKIDSKLKCEEKSPCKWSDKSIWEGEKVPTKKDCKIVELNGGNTAGEEDKNIKYIEIDINIDIETIKLSTGVIVSTSKELPNQSQTNPFLIENLEITNSKLILKNIKISSVINKLLIKDSGDLLISSSIVKFERVEVLEGSIGFNVENSFIELISDNTDDTDGNGTKDPSNLTFKIQPHFTNSELIIKYLDKSNEPNCFFEKGIISTIDKNRDHGVVSSGSTKIIVGHGKCTLYAQSEFNDLDITGLGFAIGSDSNVIINGNFNNTNGIDIYSNSIIRFQLPNDENDDEDDANDKVPKPLPPPASKGLIVSNLNFKDTTSTLIIGNSGENNNQFINVSISNIKNGIIHLENVVEKDIRLLNLEDTFIETEIGNTIIIEKSNIQYIKSQGVDAVDMDSLLHLEHNVKIIKGMDVNISVVIGGAITFDKHSVNKIGGGKTLFINGQVDFDRDSTMTLDADKTILVNAHKDDMITLNNSTISCYNLTMYSGTLSTIGQSTLNVSGNLVLLGGDSTLSISNKDDKLYANRLIVNGDLKIYSSKSILSFYKLGKESSHLQVYGECLLDGNLNLHFSDSIQSHSEYHILQCGFAGHVSGGKYKNQFKSINLYLDETLIDPVNYQIETSDAIYLITEETEQDDVNKTLGGWTVVTVLSISAFAILIITFYLFYKNKFKKQTNNHYLPVELTEMTP